MNMETNISDENITAEMLEEFEGAKGDDEDE